MGWGWRNKLQNEESEIKWDEESGDNPQGIRQVNRHIDNIIGLRDNFTTDELICQYVNACQRSYPVILPSISPGLRGQVRRRVFPRFPNKLM